MILLLAVFALGAWGQTSETQVRQRIAQAAQQMKSLQCDFVQTKQLRMLNDKMVA